MSGTLTPESAENWEKAVKLRREGKTYRQIAAELDVCVRTAYLWVSNALKATIKEASAEVRQIEVDRLDMMINAIMERATAGDDPDYEAIDRVLKVMDRRAKLLGLDAPAKYSLEPAAKEYDVTTSPDKI